MKLVPERDPLPRLLAFWYVGVAAVVAGALALWGGQLARWAFCPLRWNTILSLPCRSHLTKTQGQKALESWQWTMSMEHRATMRHSLQIPKGSSDPRKAMGWTSRPSSSTRL